jgi:hypothetical protein
MLIMIMGCIGLTLNVISVIFLHGMSCWQFATELSMADSSQNTMIMRLHMAISMTLLLKMAVKVTCSKKSAILHSRFKNSTDEIIRPQILMQNIGTRSTLQRLQATIMTWA